jgi:hypothetical protein
MGARFVKMCAVSGRSCGECCQGFTREALKGLAALQAICGLTVGLFGAKYLPLDVAADLSVAWLAWLLIAGGSIIFVLGGLAATSSWCRIGAASMHSVSAAVPPPASAPLLDEGLLALLGSRFEGLSAADGKLTSAYYAGRS